jgi:epoxyqueuosine reductase
MQSVPPSASTSDEIYLDDNAERFEPRHGQAKVADRASFSAEIEALARELGLARIGFASAEPFIEAGQRFNDWVSQGHAGTMEYLAEFKERHNPGRLLPNARSLVVVAAAIPKSREPSDATSAEAATGSTERAPVDADLRSWRGSVASYALGLDYHIALRSRLRCIGQALADLSGRPVWTRACIDTAPLLEREAARRAGIGFIAKSTMLIVPGIGPRVLLATLVTDLELWTTDPMESRCGRCTACLDACPTSAFVSPYVLDARRCLSYLTIEHQGPIPREQRAQAGTHLFGCDVCQSVCPYDRSENASVMHSDAAPRPQLVEPDLRRWLHMSSTDYRRVSKRTALRRVGRAQLMRNAAVALGNTQRAEAVEPLALALAQNANTAVRAHAAWALGRVATAQAAAALRNACAAEQDEAVREEIELAMAAIRERAGQKC